MQTRLNIAFKLQWMSIIHTHPIPSLIFSKKSPPVFVPPYRCIYCNVLISTYFTNQVFPAYSFHGDPHVGPTFSFQSTKLVVIHIFACENGTNLSMTSICLMGHHFLCALTQVYAMMVSLLLQVVFVCALSVVSALFYVLVWAVRVGL